MIPRCGLYLWLTDRAVFSMCVFNVSGVKSPISSYSGVSCRSAFLIEKKGKS